MTVATPGMPRWLWIFLGLLLIYHLSILSISPLPWFDETYFASMTLSFLETGNFEPKVGPLIDHFYPQSRAYGPGYFLVTGLFVGLGGLSMEVMRAPAVLFGFLSLLLIYRIMQEGGIEMRIRIPALLVLAFDTIFLQNIHSARMDSMALCLTLAGLWALMRGFREAYFYWYALAGIAFGLAVFTTPRIAVNLTGPSLACCLFFFSGPSRGKFLRLFAVPAGIIGIYSIWVFWGFGGYRQAWDYFFGAPREALYYPSLAAGYIQGRIFIPKFQYPVVLVFLVFLGRMILGRRNADWVFWISLFNLGTYYWLVRDTGLYSVFAVPWMVMGLAFMAHSLEQGKSHLITRYSFLLLIACNAGIFVLKNTIVWLYAPSRDQAEAERQLATLIPRGSRVIGDEAYYYAVLRNGSDFQYIDRGAGTDYRVVYHQKEYRYQYIVVREPVVNPYELGHYFRNEKPQKIGTIRLPVPGSVAQNLGDNLRRLGIEIPRGYQGTVYRR